MNIRTDCGVTRPWIWQRTNLAIATGTKRNPVDRMGARLQTRLQEATSSPAGNEVRRLVRPSRAVVLSLVALWVLVTALITEDCKVISGIARTKGRAGGSAGPPWGH